jgi:hypothetical protein
MDQILSISNSIVLFILALLHIYWVMGGSFGLDAAVPTDSNGRKIFKPTRVGTLAVAFGLIVFAFVNLDFAGVVDSDISLLYIKYILGGVAAIFFIRFIGDFRYVGISKSFRRSIFAKRDTFIYSPLCLLLSISHVVLVVQL